MRSVDEMYAEMQALAWRHFPTPFEKLQRTEFLLEKVLEQWRALAFIGLPVREMRDEVSDVHKLEAEGERSHGQAGLSNLHPWQEVYFRPAVPRMPEARFVGPSSDSGSKEVAG